MEFVVGGDYTILSDAGIPLHVDLKWISEDKRHAEVTYGYSGTKRHKVLATQLLPWPYKEEK